MTTKNYTLTGTESQIEFVQSIFSVINPLSVWDNNDDLAKSAMRLRDTDKYSRDEFRAAALGVINEVSIDQINGLSDDSLIRTLKREILDFHNCDCSAVLDNRENQFVDALVRLASKKLNS